MVKDIESNEALLKEVMSFNEAAVNRIQKCSDFGIWTCSEIGIKSAVFLATRVQ